MSKKYGDLNLNKLDAEEIFSGGTSLTEILDSTNSQLTKYNASTALLQGGILTSGSTDTTINISAGKGTVSFPTGDLIEVSWDAFVDVTVTTIGISPLSSVGIDGNGNVVFEPGLFNESQLRDYIRMGFVGHADLATLNAVSPEPLVGTNLANSLFDLGSTLGPINQNGNIITPAATDLTLQRSAGNTFELSINWDVDQKRPNSFASSIDTELEWFYVRNDATGGTITESSTTNVMDVGFYDDGSGTLSAVPTNRFTITRGFFFSKTNTYLFQYPQELFNTIDEAISSAGRESIVLGTVLSSVANRVFIITKGNATDLSNTAEAEFIEGPSFFGGGIGSSTTSLITLPTTTKGDLMVFSNTNVRLPVGTESQVLSVSGATSEGVAWVDNPRTEVAVISFEKSGAVTATIALDVVTSNLLGSSGFTKLEYIGALGYADSGTAAAAGDLELSLYRRAGNQGTQRTLATGTLISTDVALTSVGAEGTLFNRKIEALKTESPVDITAFGDEFLYLDISSVGNWSLNDILINVLIRVTI